MTAWLQAANGSDRPILLRTSSTSGHGLDTGLKEHIEEDADEYAFLIDQLKMEYKPR
jgi:prolyl oligopeptidase